MIHQLKHVQQPSSDIPVSFRVLTLHAASLVQYEAPHSNDHFCIFVFDQGSMDLHVDGRAFSVSAGDVCLTFPGQMVSVEHVSAAIAGKIILFDEVLFCSDILKNELSTYNYNLSVKLNQVHVADAGRAAIWQAVQAIDGLYQALTPIKKEQARFYIKILLLSLIEYVHVVPAVAPRTPDEEQLYTRFLHLIEANYKMQRNVGFYAAQLSLSSKKLNAISKKHAGHTAIDTIHVRVLQEIKQMLLLASHSHKEIAFQLGFNSPSALNKFVRAKLKETPSELQKQLSQMYNR